VVRARAAFDIESQVVGQRRDTPAVPISGSDYARTTVALAIACMVPVVVIFLVRA
jgi:hypothetical protein